MSKLKCECGFVMVAQTMDENFLYDFVPQKILGDLLEKWDVTGEKFSCDDFFSYYNKFRVDAYKCPSCGRILIEKEPGSNVFDSFTKEI